MNSDQIKVGLDFGTHQTKICVQRTPDEGHGEPYYEFFHFKNLDGKMSFFLPSVVQVNKDDTLSYGYVNPQNEKHEIPIPLKEPVLFHDLNPKEEANRLLQKYICDRDSNKNISALVKMLEIKRKKDLAKHQENIRKAEQRYEEEMLAYKNKRCLYRYFKQATFAERPWDKDIDCITLSIWYLSYVIFKLEEEYGTHFSINMGVPADDVLYEKKRMLAVSILASAYRLVENVYQNDIEKFLKEKVDDLKKKTELVSYNPSLIDDYNMKVFPEAYASLITLTYKGKLTNGMNLTVDIGGGTTDITFFTVYKDELKIFKYWSIPRGLNYIAESSGFDYSEGDFSSQCSNEVLEKYNNKKQEIVGILIKKLLSKIKTTGVYKDNLMASLKDRIIVYAGGGSIYKSIANEIPYFSEVYKISSEMWKEETIADKKSVQDICFLLTIAYGLSLADEESDVKLCSIESIFDHFCNSNESPIDRYIDKEMV